MTAAAAERMVELTVFVPRGVPPDDHAIFVLGVHRDIDAINKRRRKRTVDLLK